LALKKKRRGVLQKQDGKKQKEIKEKERAKGRRQVFMVARMK